MRPVPIRCQLFQCTSQTFLSGFCGGGIFAPDQVRVSVQGDLGSRMSRAGRDNVHRHAALKKVRDVEMPQPVKFGVLDTGCANLEPEHFAENVRIEHFRLPAT